MKNRLLNLPVLLFVLLATLAIGVAPAAATVIHRVEGHFDGELAPEGPLGRLTMGDAIDQANGDVWVLEGNAAGFGLGLIDKFTESGEYAGVQIVGAETPQASFAFALLGSGGIAVDNSGGAGNGDVYVSDTEHGVVDRFKENGEFDCQITGKTPVSAEEIAHECNGAAGSATPDGSITPLGLAVGSSGEVYVADNAHEAIDTFSATGAYISQIKDPHLSNKMLTIAAGGTGSLYVDNHATREVVEFNSSGAFVRLLGISTQSVGVDPKTGEVYVGEFPEGGGPQLAEFAASGEPVSIIPTENEGALGGVAVNAATGKVYVAELKFYSPPGQVAIVGPDIVVPTVTTGGATGITETSVTVQGHLDPDEAHGGGEITGCEFEYGTSNAYGKTAPCAPAAPYASAADVSAAITGLTPGATYHYRLAAANAHGTSLGEDQAVTLAGLPVIDSAYARVIGRDVILRAQINPFRLDTTCRAQYVDDASFRASGYATATTLPCSPGDLGAGLGDQPVSATVKGLRVGTTYHYRFLAHSAAGLAGFYVDRTFATFGVNDAKFELRDSKGSPFTQAGGHPYELKTSFKINSFVRGPNEAGGSEGADANLKDVLTKLPAGLIGNPSATPKCTRRQLIISACPAAAQVGVLAADIEQEAGDNELEGIYNLVPPKGVAAEFGANIKTEVNVYIDAKLRTGGDYGVTAESVDSTGIAGVKEVFARFWGVPADPSHNEERLCPGGGREFGCSAEGAEEKPLLRTPTSCDGPLTTTFSADSWQNPGEFADTSVELPPITGCERVPFTPTIQVQPTSTVADSPTGLHVDLHIPQGDSPEGIAEGDLKDAVVTFPAGLTVNPSSADGLQACSEAQIGFTGFTELTKPGEPGVQTAQFTPAAAQCPDASKLGSVTVDTPLLDHPLPGAIYLARQGENPFGSLLAVYITVNDPQTGVVVKLPGEVKADPVTGQISTTVDQNPQVPFEDFKIDLFEGARGQLTTPPVCGVFSTTSLLSPWSGGAAVSSTPSFEITGAAGGGACPATVAQEPNAPSFSAGTFSPIAGSYSPFVLKLGREDGSQTLSALSVTLPEGLVGKLAGTQVCPQAAVEAAAHRSGLGEGHSEQASPSCPASSEIGVAHVGAGSGAPFYVTGKAYLGGPYQGAPFSVVVITPAVAGPFDLGTVVVRSALSIDPATARVTVKSDPFPTMLDGIPLDIRSIAVEVTRGQFTLNPTSCEKMAVVGTAFAASSQAALAAPFQVGGCNGLPFKPSFTVSTRGQTSKAGGASLTVKVSQKPGEANIHKVDLQLPVQLPSRLSTLQKACTAAVFEANPASCPAASNIGTGTAVTPLLSVPLTGPAYLVSHGGAAFPDVEFVLQANEQGGVVKIVLDGKTQITKGITYSHFETVPDAPITSFETVFPQGPYSILGTNLPASAKHSFCGQSLTVPTTLTGQNGVIVNQNTKLQVTGCKKVKKATLTRAQKLKAALKACHKKHNKHKRQACERAAHNRYGPIKHKRKGKGH
jgi:hypothetical protein